MEFYVVSVTPKDEVRNAIKEEAICINLEFGDLYVIINEFWDF